MFVLDTHCDTPGEILRGRNLALDNDNAHVDFPKLKRGEVDAAFFALYIPAELSEVQAYEHALKLYNAVSELIQVHQDKAALAVSREQAYANKDNGLFSVFLGLENGSPIGYSLERLDEFYEMGVRYMTLCHSADNKICDSCASSVKRWHGLSPFGREVVRKMNRMKMLVDVSHISDESFYDVLECSSRPVVATHSCCRALASHPRNMTDDMIKALASAGGVLQINFYPLFLSDSFASDNIRPSYKLIADHIDHVVDLVGIDYVGLGSDFDGIEVTPDGMEDISMIPRLFRELSERGYTQKDLEKIASENFFNAFCGD